MEEEERKEEGEEEKEEEKYVTVSQVSHEANSIHYLTLFRRFADPCQRKKCVQDKTKTLLYNLTDVRMLKIIVKGVLYSVGGWIEYQLLKNKQMRKDDSIMIFYKFQEKQEAVK